MPVSGSTPANTRGTFDRVRKRVLIISLSVLLVCCGGAVALGTWVFSRTATDTFGKVDFANPLAIPPLAPSHVDAQGRRVFDLVAGQGTHDFGSGHTATTWGFNGSYLGPTLRAANGEQVIVNVRNNLNVESSVHWHGMHLPAAMDGGPHQPLRAGGSWSPTWKVDQPAATVWYHPHPHGETADHVYRGLAGMFILDDATTGSLNLPKTYGIDDVPVIVQDKEFGSGGDGLRHGNEFLGGGGLGIMGGQIVVNGTYAPYLDVSTELVRLRLLNASNARSYNFGFDDNRQFTLIGTDGGDQISAAEVARWRTTNAWEVVTSLSGRLPRVYHASAGIVGVRTLARGVSGWLGSSSGTGTSATSRSTPS
jgi:FtsP/CotA-like multicopper oxidase with cupredoxin domain